jgi:hypothetical protein
MNLETERYSNQLLRWPKEGRHILAQFDADSIVVYQAYRLEIGRFAVENGRLGGPHFSCGRMSWIKPNFLWMMYRCGWATKEGQEVVLAVRLRRDGFEEILRQAIPSTFSPSNGNDHAAWRKQVEQSAVRLQWDPDHDPHGGNVARRAIQLGLRGGALKAYCEEWTVSIEDITGFVREQREVLSQLGLDALITPKEDPYPIEAPSIRKQLGMDLK